MSDTYQNGKKKTRNEARDRDSFTKRMLLFPSTYNVQAGGAHRFRLFIRKNLSIVVVQIIFNRI